MRGQRGRGQQGQQSRVVSSPVVMWVRKATSQGGLGSLVAVSISPTTPRKAGPAALGWGHKGLILPWLWAIWRCRLSGPPFPHL